MSQNDQQKIKENLKSLLSQQQAFVTNFEQIVVQLDNSELINQNIAYKNMVEEQKALLTQLKQSNDTLKQQNQQLHTALKEQIIDERLDILKISQVKIDTYFDSANNENANQLRALEMLAMAQLKRLQEIVANEIGQEKAQMQEEISAMTLRIKERMLSTQQKAQNKTLKEEVHRAYADAAAEDVSEDVIRKRMHQNNIENKIGLSWINKIGIVLILIGIVTAMQYTYTSFFNDYAKGISVFVIGALMLCAGEWLSRKEKSIFAQGLTGGGIAVLYLATFSSYFMLHIISDALGLSLSVLVTVLAVILSIWYNSKSISAFALIGGYLPFFTSVFALGIKGDLLIAAMLYIFLLNILVLSISLKKKWGSIHYLSFALNVPTLMFLISITPNQFYNILYSVVTFAMYVAITLCYPLIYRAKLKPFDIILLALNTLISCSVIYWLFEQAKLTMLRGPLALVFCLMYLTLAWFVSRRTIGERATQILFYVTAFTFAVLMIPFQLGVKWLMMGWLIEAVLLIIYGYKGKIKGMEIGGWIVFALCTVVFYVFDVLTLSNMFNIHSYQYFDLKYGAFMAGLVLVLYAYLIDMAKDLALKYTTRGKHITRYKYFVVVNLWFYAIYGGMKIYIQWISPAIRQMKLPNREIYLYENFYETVIFAAMTALVAQLIKHAPYLYDKVTKYFAIVLFVLADVVCIGLNMGMQVYETGNPTLAYFSIALLVLFNIFVFLNFKDLAYRFLKTKQFSFEIFPPMVTIYLLGVITSIIVFQFPRLAEMNLLFSLLYLVSAFIAIIFGFVKKFMLMRRFGLALTIFATAKLFIWDLRFLPTEGKIVSYFAFGIILIAISYLYQRFTKTSVVEKKQSETEA
ncbi:MAG: DUF2339 domain-containing protein [Hyphomonadaceae bacterium]|nr:DUF2339 domain-containing protein [Clostridia bacterium]